MEVEGEPIPFPHPKRQRLCDDDLVDLTQDTGTLGGQDSGEPCYQVPWFAPYRRIVVVGTISIAPMEVKED